MLLKTVPVVLAMSAGMFLFISKVNSQQAKTVSVNPQGQGTVSDTDIELMRKDLRAQKKQIVATNLPLTTEESVKFWPVYEQYIAEEIKLNDQRFAFVKEYADIYNSMTDQQASSLITRWITTDRDASNLRLKYIPIFEKVIPSKKVAMFIQIDRRLGLMMDLQLASQVPLAPATYN